MSETEFDPMDQDKVWSKVQGILDQDNVTNPMPVVHRCVHCDHTASSKYALRKHLKTHDITLQCPSCDYTTNHRANMRAHRRMHLKKIKCPRCPFKECLEKLEIHAQETHNDTIENLKWRCEECGASFMRMGMYREHRAQHATEVSLYCNKCEEGFPNHELLVEHRLTVHKAVAKTVYVCDKCGESYKMKRSFIAHTYKHNGQPLPFVCELCPFKSAWKSSLKVHMATHTP